MTIETGLALLACFIGGGMGLYGLVQPQWIAAITRLEATAPEGRSEFRASFAGLFSALHLAAAYGVITGTLEGAMAAAVVGLGWWGAAFGRGLSFAFDNAYTRLNLFNIVFEVALGAMLISPYLALRA